MPGNKTGGMKAATTNKKKYGDDFYKRIGSRGGRATGPKGFALMDPEKVKAAGSKGGKKSRRTGVTTGQGKKKEYYDSGDGKFKKDSPKPKREPEPEKRTFIDKILGR